MLAHYRHSKDVSFYAWDSAPKPRTQAAQYCSLRSAGEAGTGASYISPSFGSKTAHCPRAACSAKSAETRVSLQRQTAAPPAQSSQLSEEVLKALHRVVSPA